MRIAAVKALSRFVRAAISVSRSLACASLIVLSLINGVRVNNSTFRPGANQYTALIAQDFAERVEIVRGPGSTQYGSGSLGGTINVLTRPVNPFDSFAMHGGFNTYFASADLSAGVSASISGGSQNWIGAAGRRTQGPATGRG